MAVATVLILCIARMNVVIALTTGAVVAGVVAGLPLRQSIELFANGLGDGAKIALSYAILGAFASALAHSGLPDAMMVKLAEVLKVRAQRRAWRNKLSTATVTLEDDHVIKFALFLSIGLISIACKNVIPVHIAFIPVLIPPLLKIFNSLKIDRRIISCIITFGVIVSYMTIPMGFGEIFLDNIMAHYLSINGLKISLKEIIFALSIPAIGMSFGLLCAFYHYRRPRIYQDAAVHKLQRSQSSSKKHLIITSLAIIVVLAVQIVAQDTILSALAGFIFLSLGGVVGRRDADNVVADGFKMMAMISFIMLAAAGFGHVLRATGGIDDVVQWVARHAGNGKALASLGMLLIGFLISVGIGSAFCTVPIVASVYVPLGIQLGFSPAAIAVIVAVSGIAGDTGSPTSDSILGPTMGLGADNQHDLIKDAVIPAFLHLTLPVFIFGWIGSLILL